MCVCVFIFVVVFVLWNFHNSLTTKFIIHKHSGYHTLGPVNLNETMANSLCYYYLQCFTLLWLPFRNTLHWKLELNCNETVNISSNFFFRITILNPFYFYYYMTIRTVRVSLSLLHLNLSLFILNSRAPANDSNHTLNRWCVCICYIYMCTDFDRRCVTHTNAVTLVSTEIHFAYPLDIWLWMHLMADIYIIIELLWNYFMHFI